MIETIRKKLMTVILAMAITIILIPAMTLTASAAEAGSPSTSLSGSGTDAEPFLITSAADLAYMRNQVNADGNITPSGGGDGVPANEAHYKLTADIILGYWQDDGDGIVDDGEIYDSASGGTVYSESNWTPIGLSRDYPFFGTFDGDGYTVSGIYINSSSYNQGLFGYVRGTVKNVGVKNSYIKGSGNIGGVAGLSHSTLSGCYNTGSVIGTNGVGGVVGCTYNTVQYCYNTGNIFGEYKVGGIVGYTGVSSILVQYCYNTGSISGTTGVGGIVGDSIDTVQYCYNTGSVSGTSYAGGVVGKSTRTATGCYYDKQMCTVGGINGQDINGSAEGKLTAEMTSGTAFTGWSSGDTGTWNFTSGLYPRLTGYVDESTDYNMDETDTALVSALPIILASSDTAATIKSDFTLSMVPGVTWTSSNESVICVNDTNGTVEGDGSATLTASLGDVTKSVTMTVDITAPTLQSAARGSDTQITVTLSEPCVNLTNANDGGFTVTETGTSTTFAVYGTAQGADTSHVELNVADMDTAKAKGVTVTYTAGGNGIITDIVGNSLATNSTRVVIAPWIPKLNTPGNLSWDITTPAKATWDAVANASSYTIQLYKDGTASGTPVSGITNTNYDFTSVITETGSYTFTVTAVGDGMTYADSDVSSNSPAHTVTFSAPVAGFGNALNFPADSGSMFNVPYNDSTKLAGNSDFTISMWISPDAQAPYKTLYRQHGSGDGSLGVWLRYIKSDDNEGYLYFGFDKFGTGWQWPWDWNGGIPPSDVAKLPLNQWTHVAFTKSGKSIKIYANGTQYYEMTLDDIHFGASAPVDAVISVGGESNNQYFDGRIDEIQFWNTTLTQAEIEAWMYREIDSTHNKYDNLVYYYKLNESSGSAVADSKGTNDGTAINITDSNWVSSDIQGWTVNAGTTLNGKLVGSDIDGTSTNGSDWKLTFAIETQGAKGEAAITEDNQFTYTAGINQEGSDSFQYKVCDINGKYSNVQTVNIDIIAAKIISGNAGVAGAALSYNDGTAKTATADGTGAYSFKVPNNWSGTVTPSKDGYTFSPANKVYTNVEADQTEQNYTATSIITAASVSGIIAPAAGEIPIGKDSLEGTSAYTVTNLTWQNSDGSIATLTDESKFKAGSTYQAVIELTAAVGYKFQVLTPTVNAGTTGAGTIDAEGSKLTFTVTFATTEDQSVAAITVKTQPTKLSYTAGETLDLTGLEVMLTYNDESTADIAYAQFEENCITANPDQGTTMNVVIHNGQPVTLTCNTRTALTNTLTVNKADITGITFADKTITYDGTEQNLEISGTLPDGASVNYTANTGTNAGTYNATATITGGTNYNDLTLNATLTINKAVLTAAVEDYSKTYGDNNPAFAVEVTGFVNGESAETAAGYSTPTAGTAATAATGVGTADITISGGTATNYTFDTSDKGTLTISKKVLTPTAAADDKTYDGTAAASGTINLAGVVGTDNVTASGSFAFESADAGADKTVNVTGITLAGTDAGNYTVNESATTTADIEKANITGITFADKTITYDGTEQNLEISGTLPDGASVNYTANTGTKAETYNATATINGGTNYNDLTLNATLTINKAVLTAAVEDYSKTYGEENPAFEVQVTGFVNGESAATAAGYSAPTAGTAATAATGVGTADITISEGAATNYTFDISDKGTLTISKKELTPTAVANDKTYDGTAAASGTINLAGVVETDNVTASGSFAFESADAGADKTVSVTGITLAGTDAGNYTVNESTTTTADIEKADITGITFADKTKTYDGTEQNLEISGTLPDGASVNYTANTGTNVGTYNATATINGGTNYNDTTLTATLTINKAVLTAAVEDYSKTYGDNNPAFAVEVTGFVNGESAETAAGYSTPTAGTAATAATGVGTEDITISGGTATNYTFDTSDNGTLTISKKVLTPTAVADDKTYDGTAAASGTINLAGVVETDNVTASGSFAFESADAGADKTVNVTGITLAGTDAGNYTVNESTATTADIVKTNITGITFADKTITYDGTEQNLEISGTLPDGASVNYTANTGTNAGTYNATATITGGTNYNDLTLNATLTINKAILTAAVEDYSKTYGEENPVFEVQVTGFVNGESAETAAGYSTPTANTAATAATRVGTTDITITGGEADNYTFIVSDKGTLTISKKVLTPTAVADDKTYDGTVTAAGTINLAGVVGTDNVTASGSFAFESADAGADKTINVTEITLRGSQAGNYSLSTTTVTAIADITKEISSINVTTLPTKTIYEYGEALNTEGGIVTVTYSDNSTSTAVLTNDLCQMAGTPAIGERIVTVTYLNQTTGFSVTYIKATQATPAVPVCSMTDEGITVTSPLGTEYEYSKDGGTNWQTDVTFRYLIHGNQYTIVTRLIETDTYLASNASEGTTIKFRNLNKQKSGETEVDIIINDNIETAATSKTTIKNNKTVTTITINDNKIVEKLNNESDNAIVSIQVDNTTDVVKGQLNGETVKNMEMKSAILEIKTKNITYTLPASQVNIDNVSLQIGTQVELKDIMVDVKIAEPPADTVKFVEDIANKNNYQVVVKPVEFEINCTSRNKTVQVSKFNGYVERTVAIPDGIDPSKITTGIVLNSDGTFSHVPTTIIQVNDKYFAKINSLTNSIYSVIYCPKTFKDVENHWAKKDVNDMGSRLIINGVDDNRFEPERDITRAEFATIAVKALGLMRPSSGKETFLDVEKTAWYYDAVSIACEYKLISGYADGTFKPNKKITREEAMKIILNALEIVQDDTTLPESDIQEQLANFIDSNEVSSWAQKAVATCIKSGIVQGNNNKVFVKENITRAQTATIIRRMLQKTELI